MATTLESYQQFASDFDRAAAERRKRLAETLSKTGQQTFEMANPYLLEDLNSRGLFTSQTARDKSQADALKEIALSNEQQLSDFDTDVFNQGQSILATGMGTDLQRQFDLADQAQEEALARSLARQQSRNQLTTSLLGLGSNLAMNPGLFGGGSTLGVALGGSSALSGGIGGGLGAVGSGALSGTSVGGGLSGAAGYAPGSTLGSPAASGLRTALGTAGRGLGLAASLYGGASLGQNLGRSIFGQKGLNDKATSRGVKAGSLVGAGLGSAFGPLGSLAGGALGSAVGGVAGKGVREVSKGVKSVAKGVSKAFKGLCFDGNTLVLMADGSEMPIKNIGLGQETNGGKVISSRISLTEDGNLYNYAGVTVTGSHAVLENGRWIRVEDSEKSIPLDGPGVVYSLVTSQHRIYSNGITFADEFESDDHEELSIDESLDLLNGELEVVNG